MSVLLVVEPLALVVGTISVRVGAHAFSLVIYPLPLIDITISMHQLSLPVSFIVAPLAFIATAIRPELGANAIARAVQPLACILSAIAKGIRALRDAAILIDLLIRGWSLQGARSVIRRALTQRAKSLVLFVVACAQ